MEQQSNPPKSETLDYGKPEHLVSKALQEARVPKIMVTEAGRQNFVACYGEEWATNHCELYPVRPKGIKRDG